MTVIATRLPLRELAPNSYICSRCGIQRSTVSTRPRPELCRDCKSVARPAASTSAARHG